VWSRVLENVAGLNSVGSFGPCEYSRPQGSARRERSANGSISEVGPRLQIEFDRRTNSRICRLPVDQMYGYSCHSLSLVAVKTPLPSRQLLPALAAVSGAWHAFGGTTLGVVIGTAISAIRGELNDLDIEWLTAVFPAAQINGVVGGKKYVLVLSSPAPTAIPPHAASLYGRNHLRLATITCVTLHTILAVRRPDHLISICRNTAPVRMLSQSHSNPNPAPPAASPDRRECRRRCS